MSKATSLEIGDGVARIGIDDGKVNALSSALIAEIAEALHEAEAAEAVVVLRGRQGMFSAGFDLKSFARGPEAGLEMVVTGAALVQQLLSFPFPVVTWCAGHAYPAGAFLMLAADVRFGIPGRWRIGMNEVAIGLTVPRFAVELARHRLTPAGFARITTAPMFDPEEARQFGYLDYVVDDEHIASRIEEEVARLRQLDMKSYAATKARVNEHVLTAVEAAVEDERRALAQADSVR